MQTPPYITKSTSMGKYSIVRAAFGKRNSGLARKLINAIAANPNTKKLSRAGTSAAIAKMQSARRGGRVRRAMRRRR
jgi:hypothetical protein